MVFFLIGVLSVIVGTICIIYAANKCRRGAYPQQKKVALAIAAIAILVGVGGISMDCITTIPTGHTGIVTTFGRVEDYNFDAGMHIKAPWQQVVKMDNRIQKGTLEMSCFSSDFQEVDTVYTINYQINKKNAQTIYSTIGQDYYEKIILHHIEESVKNVIRQYDAEALIENRDKLSMQIKDDLTAKLASYNIEVVATSVENLDFSDLFTAAVEAKQVAAQEKLKAEIQQEQANIEAKAAAERAVIAAEAQKEKAILEAEAAAESKKIEADALAYAGEKEAEANKKISESLTNELIEYKKTEQWDGKLPTFVGGDGTIPVLNFGNNADTAE